MSKKTIFYKLIGIGLVAAFILTSCTFATTPVATATLQASSTPLIPTATATLVPSATDTATPLPTATPAPTEPATPTTPLIAQVNPGMNAYCRKGPGTDYFSITYLQVGTFYNVVGQNGLQTWWLIQVPGNVTCWMGDPTSVTQGPVDQVPILMAPPLPGSPSSFTNTSHCDPVLNTMTVRLTWELAQGATGYNIFRNGSLIAQLGAKNNAYTDNAPRG